MLQNTVTGKTLVLLTMVNSTITPFTNRYGAILRRNWITGGASQRRSSSEVAPASGRVPATYRAGAYGPSTGAAKLWRGAGDGAAGATGTGARDGGASRVSSAATSAAAVGKR